MHSINEISPTVPAFLAKLWRIVQDPEVDDLIRWNQNENGRSFILQNQNQIAKEILPKYYKHNNMSSFIRQLNMYGFHKIVTINAGSLTSDSDEMEFAHPYFIQGNPKLLDNIKRKIANPRNEDGLINDRFDYVNTILVDMQQLKGKQEDVDTKLSNMKKENDILWKELASLRQKHSQQQQIVNRLIQFLVSMIQSNRSGSVGLKRKYPLMIDTTNCESLAARNFMEAESPNGPVISDVTDGYIEEKYIIPEESMEVVIDSPASVNPGLIEPESVSPAKRSKKKAVKHPPAVASTSNSVPSDNLPAYIILDSSDAPMDITEGISIPVELNTSDYTLSTGTDSLITLTAAPDSSVDVDDVSTTETAARTVPLSRIANIARRNSTSKPPIHDTLLGMSTVPEESRTIELPLDELLDAKTDGENVEIPSTSKAMTVAIAERYPSPQQASLPIPYSRIKSTEQDELEGQVDDIQYQLDTLRDLLKGDSYLDSSLLGVRPFFDLEELMLPKLFGNNDILSSLSMMDNYETETRDGSSETGLSGNELMAFTNPSLLELGDDDSPFQLNVSSLNDDLFVYEKTDVTSASDDSTLNTPLPSVQPFLSK